MKRILIIGLLLLTCIIGFVLFGILIPAGIFKEIHPHFGGTVIKINLIEAAGPEDITIDQQSGIAYISTDDRRINTQSPGSIEGKIFVMNLSDSLPSLRNVTTASITDFHPHGISLWTNPDGRKYLFAINHRQKNPANVIERFEWRNDSLIYLESIQDENLMTSPNDVVAVGERSFYVTNDHGYSKKGIGRTLEDFLQRSISYVNYYDGTSFRKVASDIAYANGINHSSDNTKIFVTSTTGRKIYIYDRSPATGELTLNQIIDTKTGVDNIELDETGSLWIGCHPQMLKFVAHASDPAKFSPSQVIKLSINSNGEYEQKEIFLNNGAAYSGSSVAAVYNNTLLIGSVFENSILYCILSAE
jgi:arylesterase / paraoxonase